MRLTIRRYALALLYRDLDDLFSPFLYLLLPFALFRRFVKISPHPEILLSPAVWRGASRICTKAIINNAVPAFGMLLRPIGSGI